MRKRTFIILGATLALLLATGYLGQSVGTGGVAPPSELVVMTVKESPLSATVPARFHRVDVETPPP